MPPAAKPRLLAVDDEEGILALLTKFGRAQGFDVTVRTGGAEALAFLHEMRPDAVIVDFQMPGMDGLDVLRAIRSEHPECQVVLMSGTPTVDSVIEAVKLGALDYLNKPVDLERLAGLLAKIKTDLIRREALFAAAADVAGRFEFHGMIGPSPVMQDLFDAICRFGPHARTVLITGETGTGKELIAKALHESGPRRTQKFVTVNCSALVENLLESELFGHTRGAFTGATEAKTGMFEHADRGTLFLDEVGELSLAAQAKLLRAVEQGEVQRVGSLDRRRADVHIVAATNRNLREDASAGRFRADLFYRLGVIELQTVPLRDRRSDIPFLTARFVRQFGAQLKRQISGVSTAAERLLEQQPWPGNVRELRNVIERACILSEGTILGERDVQRALPPPVAPLNTAAASANQDLATVHREQIIRVLAQCEGNRAAAARALGLSRRSLYRWLDRLNIH